MEVNYDENCKPLRPNQERHGDSYMRKSSSICRFLYALEVASSPNTDQQHAEFIFPDKQHKYSVGN